jgi:hypothetical protein
LAAVVHSTANGGLSLDPRDRVFSGTPSGPLGRRRDRMAFMFRLETVDGAAAEPATFTTAVPNWRAGDTIPLGGRTLRVVDLRDEDADQPPVLVVEDAAGAVTSDAA